MCDGAMFEVFKYHEGWNYEPIACSAVKNPLTHSRQASISNFSAFFSEECLTVGYCS